MNKQNGFTLIELVIAMAIIGILVAVALPAYQGYVQKAACEDGKSLLSQASAAMERARAQNNGTYNANTAMPISTAEFRVAVANVTASAYELTATATSTLSGTLTVNAANVRGGDLAGQCGW